MKEWNRVLLAAIIIGLIAFCFGWWWGWYTDATLDKQGEHLLHSIVEMNEGRDYG